MRTGEIIEEICKAWHAQDLNRTLWFFSDEFSHNILVPQTVHPLGGMREGKQAVAERLEEIINQFDFQSVDVNNILADEKSASAELHIRYRHRLTGTELTTRTGHFWTMKNGRALLLTEYHDVARVQEFADKILVRI